MEDFVNNETFRYNSLPQETQAAIDAANARASEAEARAERAEAPFRVLRNCFRLLMRGAVVIVIHYVSMVMIYDFFWNQHPIEDQVAFVSYEVEPQPTSSIPNPPRPVIISLPTQGAGYLSGDFINCRTGQPYSRLAVPDPEHTGIRIYDGVSSRPVQGCPPVSARTTPARRVRFNDIRVEPWRAPEPVAPPKQTSAPETCGAIDRFRSTVPALAAQLERLGERMSAVEQDFDRHPLLTP